MSQAESREVELRGEVARLRVLVEEMQGRLDRIDQNSGLATGGDQRRSRRELFKVAGAGVAGAAAAALLGIRQAEAADGDNLILGNTAAGVNKTNEAGHTTRLTATAATTPTPLLQVVGPNAVVPANSLLGPIQGFGASLSEGVNGYAPGASGAGVFGLSDTGYGVIGETASGVDLAAIGTGRLYQYSLTDGTNPIAGPPNFTPAQPPGLPGGELMRDVDSVIWASRATGTMKAAWKRMNTVRVDDASGSGAAFTPIRIIDTRVPVGGIAGPLQPGTYSWGPFNGTNIIGGAHDGTPSGIPSDAVGIVGNLAVTGYSGQGFLAIFPKGAPYDPGTSPASINFSPAWAWANAFTVGFGTLVNQGWISIHVGFVPTHVIVDVVGYIQ